MKSESAKPHQEPLSASDQKILDRGEIPNTSYIGPAQCLGDSYPNHNCDASGALTLGLVGLVVFKVWEIIDLWFVPPEINRRFRELQSRRYGVSFEPVLLPVANYKTGQYDGGVLGLQMRF